MIKGNPRDLLQKEYNFQLGARRMKFIFFYVIDSIKVDLICCVMAEGWPSFNLKTDSMTEISVEVVSCPQKAVQSLTTIPAPITSEPLFTVPATNGTLNVNKVSRIFPFYFERKIT